MRFGGLIGTADLIGRRIRLRWDFELDALETPGAVPDVLLRRKTSDFAFPPLVPGDPYLIYDSAGFPPAPIPGALQVIDLPDWEGTLEGLRARRETISVSRVTDGVPLEVIRRVRTVFFDDSEQPVRLRDDILDARDLNPQEQNYYELDDGSGPTGQQLNAYRSVVAAGEIHGLNRQLWDMVPEVYRKHDLQRPPPANQFPGVPEAGPSGGQMRRFVDMFGMGSDLLRNSAEGLRGLRKLDTAAPQFLDPLGRMIGWDGPLTAPLPQQRNELSTATRLFNVVGTVQSLRALVTVQTGWRAQVGEFAQNIARSNTPPRRSIYVRREEQVGWRGAMDAAHLFGFPAGTVIGGAGVPAVLNSALVEPFALSPGDEITLSVDGDAPARVRFGPDDFARIEAATAAEVASVLNLNFDNIIARDVGGALQIETVLTGTDATLRIERSVQSLLALSDAPDGQVCPLRQSSGTMRVFYLQRNDPGLAETAPFAPTQQTPAQRRTDRDIRYKSWDHGEMRGELPLPDWSQSATGLGATSMPDGSVWLGFVRQDRALMHARGTSRAPIGARLTTLRAEPFVLAAGTQVSFQLRNGVETFTVNPADFLNPAVASAVELAAAMTAQFVNLNATALPDGAVRIETVQTGDLARLSIDLSTSTAARDLGLAARDLRSSGVWDAEIDWGPVQTGPQTWNPVEAPSVVADPLGGVRLAWAEHQDSRWHIRTAHGGDRMTVATPAGVAQREGDGPWTVWTTVDGLPSDTVRDLAADADGSLWFATDAGLGQRRADGTWQTFAIVDGLLSDDLRALTILPSGNVACASSVGLSEIEPGGTISTTTSIPNGLIGNDIRALAADGLGGLWLATTNGLSHRNALDQWQSWAAADGLPAAPPTALAVATDGRVLLATSGGVVLWDGAAWRAVDEHLPSPDVRDAHFAPDGTLYLATALGLARLRDERWRSFTTAEGLPTNNLSGVSTTADGQLMLSTPNGLAVGNLDADPPNWQVNGLAQGLPSSAVVAAHANWSAPRILTPGNAVQRDPHIAVEASGDIWLFCAERQDQAAQETDNWTLQLRRQDAATLNWAAVQPITVALPGGSSDRTPWAEPDVGGGFRVFFGTNRQGGQSIGWLALDAVGAAGAISLLPPDGHEMSFPATVIGPDGASWMFHRADTPVIQAQTALVPDPGSDIRASLRVPEADAASHRSGARSPVLAHAARHALRRRFADPGVYTPDHPDRIDAELPGSPHIYTRRTLGLYLRQSPFGSPITQDQIARLLQLLGRFLPINLRIMTIVAPDPLTERLYPPGADIEERWFDNIPFVDRLDGLSDATSVTVPGLSSLISNDVAHLSADFADLNTLLRRVWFPDLL